MSGITVRIDEKAHITQRLVFLTDTLNKMPDSNYPLDIKVMKESRSERQNRFLWGWIYRLLEQKLEEAGIVIPSDDGREYPYTKDLLHEIMKEQFLVYAEIKRGDKVRKLCWSTTELTKSPKETEFGDRPSFNWYVEKVRQFASQYWHIEIPDPPVQHYEYPEIVRDLQQYRAAA